MRDVYALLVGLDRYDERLRRPLLRFPLRGCINDVQKMQAYLEGRTAKAVNLHLRVLKNEQATRQNVIDGFRQHLAQAKNGDTALFYFAGYGARIIAPLRSADTLADASTAAIETLVCYDTHTANAPEGAPQELVSRDLADRELAQLLADISAQQAHVVAIVDARSASTELSRRPAQSFMPARSTKGRHILLKACSPTEKACEFAYSGQSSGVFSHLLQASLVHTNGSLTYRDLMSRMNALVRNSFPAQSPQILATHPQDLDLPFLGEGTISPLQPYFTVSHDAIQGWILNGGAVHGLSAPDIPAPDANALDVNAFNEYAFNEYAATTDETTVLTLFPPQATPEQMQQSEHAIATAQITRVQSQFSTVASPMLENASKAETFKALVVGLPLPPLPVQIVGERGEAEALRRAISTAGPGNRNSLYVRPTERGEEASLCVLAQGGIYTVTSALGDRTHSAAQHSTEQRSLTDPIVGYDSASAMRVVSALEHIARWKTIVELASPANSMIQGAVELKLYTGDEADKNQATEIKDTQVRLTYKEGAKDSLRPQTPPRFRLKLRNRSNQTLYCALFYLTERFKAAAVKPDKINSIVQLAPNEEIWFADGLPLYGTVPDDLWQQGITECQDAMKLVACTRPFDPTLMNLGPLGTPINTHEAISTDSLNYLMQRIINREIASDSELTPDSWATTQIAFTFVRPQLPVFVPVSQSSSDRRPIPISASAASLAPATLYSHPQFQSKAQLTTLAQVTHLLGDQSASPQLPIQPFFFTQGRNSAPGLSVLKLTEIEHAESITAEQPLRLEANLLLAEDEFILPVAYDGEVYLPLGYGRSAANDAGDRKTQIVIERLPLLCKGQSSEDQSSEGQSSESQSSESQSKATTVITFHTVKLSHAAAESRGAYGGHPLLSAAQVSREGTLSYLREKDEIALKVKHSSAIALYLPSAFNPTEADLPSLNRILTAAGRPYDLILTFDYDAFASSLEQNAQTLKACLAEVGLAAAHQKKLHIIAHSTGGLLARWFIEQAGGNSVVDHLFMLGTPNAGISSARMQSGMSAAVALALNGLSEVPTTDTIGEFGRFVAASQIAESALGDRAFEQMHPNADWMLKLRHALDPGVPYTLVVGNLLNRTQGASWQETILRKLSPSTAGFSYREPNDLAVSVESQSALPKDWNTPLQKLAASCHHLEYLVHSTCRAELSRAIASAAKQPKRPSSAKASSSLSQAGALPKHPPQAMVPPTLNAGTAAATSAGIAAASAAIASPGLSFSKTPVTTGLRSMHEPPQPQDPQQPSSPQPPSASPGEPPPATTPFPVSSEPVSVAPEDVYAPEYEAAPESKSSPLMWVWVLSTAVLAGIVALLWIDYFNSPVEPAGRESVQPVPDATESELPSSPEEAPISPDSGT